MPPFVEVIKHGGSAIISLNKKIRERYGINPGDYLDITLEEDGFKCRKIKDVIIQPPRGKL